MLSELIAFGVSLVGAYFTAALIMKKTLAAKVTHLKLIGFILFFLISFFILMYACSWLMPRTTFSR